MSPDVELELRRLGGVDGTINLLRQPAVGESSDTYAGRVELGAALLACKIGLGDAHTKCGATSAISSGSGVDGRGCQPQLVDSSAVATLRESWEPRALTAAINALLQGGRDVVGTRARCACVVYTPTRGWRPRYIAAHRSPAVPRSPSQYLLESWNCATSRCLALHAGLDVHACVCKYPSPCRICSSGGCSPKARSILLKVVVALGSRVPEAGVTSLLFDVLCDDIACSDTESES